MQKNINTPNKLTFSGHNTFHCRHLWLNYYTLNNMSKLNLRVQEH